MTLAAVRPDSSGRFEKAYLPTPKRFALTPSQRSATNAISLLMN